MYLAPGEMTEDELLAKAGNGVYINSLGGLHAGANPITGDFSLQSAGFMIENGKKTTAVKSFTVAGNYYDLLKNITDVASNLELPGMGRFGAPSVLVQGLSIAGK
jgi:PmbA protein